MADLRVRYKSNPDAGLEVRLIKTWHRGEIPSLAMSNSSGAKETMKNTIYTLFDRDPAIDAITMVRASGSPILIIRKGQLYFDVRAGRPGEVPHLGAEIEVLQKRPAVPVLNVRPADTVST